MNKLFRPSAAAALFVTAAFVACNGGAGYTPTSSSNFSEQSSRGAQPLTALCTAKQEGPGTYLTYVATGNVRGTTFTAITGKSAFAFWELTKYKKVKPTPTPSPSPSPSPSTSPSPTPTPVQQYVYTGTFAMKNMQVGCAYLFATKSKKKYKGTDYNAITEGFPNVKPGHYHDTLVQSGNVSHLVISHLSSKGGSGTVTLVESNGKPYTTGTITLTKRTLISDVKRLLDLLPELETDQ